MRGPWPKCYGYHLSIIIIIIITIIIIFKSVCSIILYTEKRIHKEEPHIIYYYKTIIVNTFSIIIISIVCEQTQILCVIVFLARDIPPFVMYCVNGKPRSSLFIESTDS